VANSFFSFSLCAFRTAGKAAAATLLLLSAFLGAKPACAQSAPFTARPPVLDGNADAVWSRAPVLPIRRLVFGRPSGDADLSATFRALWDRTGLYLLVEVRDDTRVNDSTQRYDDDGVEVYLDVGNKKLDIFGATDYQYYFSYGENRAVESKHNAHHRGIRFATRDTREGYRMEIRLSWATLSTVAPPLAGRATRLGLDVHVNDDDNGVTRDHKMAWHAIADNSYESPRRFGTITLRPPRNVAEAAAAPPPIEDSEDDPVPAQTVPGATSEAPGANTPAPVATSATPDAVIATGPAASSPGGGASAPLLAVAGVAALIAAGLGMRGLIASRQPRGGPAVIAPQAGRPVTPPLPQSPPPFTPAEAAAAALLERTPPADAPTKDASPEQPAAPVVAAPEPSMALRPSSRGASPLASPPPASRRVPPAAAAWPWAGGSAKEMEPGGETARAGGARASSAGAVGAGSARLVGVSQDVLGIVVPLGEGAPYTDEENETPAEVEAAAFTDPSADPDADGDDTTSTDQVRILVRPDGGFVLRPLERPEGMKTFLNDRLVHGEQALQTGDEIQIGTARFRFEA
jgi:hypothetical protein